MISGPSIFGGRLLSVFRRGRVGTGARSGGAFGFVSLIFLRFRDQGFDFLAALVPDLLVEVRAVLVLDDPTAFLTDRLVELRAVTFTRGLTALTADRLVEARAVALANGISALLTGLTNGHLAARRLYLLRFFLLGLISHQQKPFPVRRGRTQAVRA
jgi:hypothetical protein